MLLLHVNWAKSQVFPLLTVGPKAQIIISVSTPRTIGWDWLNNLKLSDSSRIYSYRCLNWMLIFNCQFSKESQLNWRMNHDDSTITFWCVCLYCIIKLVKIWPFLCYSKISYVLHLRRPTWWTVISSFKCRRLLVVLNARCFFFVSFEWSYSTLHDFCEFSGLLFGHRNTFGALPPCAINQLKLQKKR